MAGLAFKELRKFLDNEVQKAATQAARQGALQIVNDLQRLGPYWDGYFYYAWEVREGDVAIPADQVGANDRASKANPHPNKGAFTLNDIPNPRITFRGKAPTFTIGNRMVYRDTALDLEPGRIKNGGNETAPQDWYLSYYAGGEMDSRVSQAIQRRISLPD